MLEKEADTRRCQHAVQKLFEVKEWDEIQVKSAFVNLIHIALRKANHRFDFSTALSFATIAFDIDAFTMILKLNSLNVVEPEEIFELFARNAAQELLEQFEIVKKEYAGAVLVRSHPAYEDGRPNYITTSSDFLLKYIKDEIDLHEIRALNEQLKIKMEEKGLGIYANILRWHLQETNLNKYRELHQEDKLLDLLTVREGEFLNAVESSMSKGKSEQEAVRLNWDVLIQ